MSGRQQRVMVQPIVREFPSQIVQDRVHILIPLGRMSFSKISNRYFSYCAEIASNAFIDTSISIQRTKVVIWLYDNIDMRIEGRIIVRVISNPHATLELNTEPPWHQDG